MSHGFTRTPSVEESNPRALLYQLGLIDCHRQLDRAKLYDSINAALRVWWFKHTLEQK